MRVGRSSAPTAAQAGDVRSGPARSGSSGWATPGAAAGLWHADIRQALPGMQENPHRLSATGIPINRQGAPSLDEMIEAVCHCSTPWCVPSLSRSPEDVHLAAALTVHLLPYWEHLRREPEVHLALVACSFAGKEQTITVAQARTRANLGNFV